MSKQWEQEKAMIEIIDALPSIAQSQKVYYDELIKSGFNEAEAFKLVSIMVASLFTRNN